MRFGHFALFLLAVGLTLGTPTGARAQTWNIDARVVGLGGIGGEQNIFTSGLASSRGDRSLALPFGLFRLLQQRQIFDPRSADFNPLRALAFAASPMHAPLAGGTSAAADLFATDVRNGTVSRDLNQYRGFTPHAFQAARLIAPRWGHTFAIGSRQPDAALTHHLYLGAGPHLALRTAVDVNGPFSDFLYAANANYVRNGQLSLANQTTGQMAIAITGGYRGSYRLGGDTRLHVMVNVNHLRGLRYESADVALTFQTDLQGLVSTSGGGAPLTIDRRTSTRGVGRSADVGFGVEKGRWEVGVSGQNIGNRMTWRDASRRTYAMANVTGLRSQFAISAPTSLGTIVEALPEAYRANLSYRFGTTQLQLEAGREGDRRAVRGGVEHTVGRFELRGAASLLNDAWQPSVGVSVPLTRRFWADTALFSSTANLEMRRQYSLALSLRVVR